MDFTNGAAADFVEFDEPLLSTDRQVYRPDGPAYRCGGCGGTIPDGQHVHVDTRARDDRSVVVGIYARGGADGPVTHACGTLAGKFDEINDTIADRDRRQHEQRRAEMLARARRNGEER